MDLPEIERGEETAEPASPHRTKLYRNGASQAVRIPKALAYDEDIEVEMIRRGDAVIVRPARRSLAGIGDALRRLGEALGDQERDQGEARDRAW